uniref:Peptidase S1 domain-containing protein n=1 Tax=Amphilophus citrinellus TaxID=61819 RepID=A0A3Q0QUE3_AMPCI
MKLSLLLLSDELNEPRICFFLLLFRNITSSLHHRLMLTAFFFSQLQGSDIIHGKKVPEGLMLYMASVQNDAGHVCGGFLIREDLVVTAAHCYVASPTHVVLGTHNLQNGLGENIQIKQTFMYGDYNGIKQGGDIMILKVSTYSLLYLFHMTYICDLIVQITVQQKKNQVCQVAGWGKTENESQSHELRVVSVSIISPQVCQEQWRPFLHLPPNVTCAGGYKTNKGFCQEDSGGPLVCSGFAAGVVSFNRNLNCKYPDVPNVYVDISKYLQWIDKILK